MSNIPGINSVTTELRTRSTPSQANNENVAPKAKASQAVTVSDESTDKSVQLSETAKVLNEVQKELDSFPIVDETRVSALKAKIASGDYYPDGAKIAGKIIMLEGLIPDEPT